jgi:hypothetical protein
MFVYIGIVVVLGEGIFNIVFAFGEDGAINIGD